MGVSICFNVHLKQASFFELKLISESDEKQANGAIVVLRAFFVSDF